MREKRKGRRKTHSEVHHARLGGLLDVLALRNLGVGVELLSSVSKVLGREEIASVE